MSKKLELVREEKLYRLLPGKKKNSRLEASGVALINDTRALVVFDNLKQIASIDTSLEMRSANRLFPAPSLGAGFEDIAIDRENQRVFCLIETLEDIDGLFRGFVAEYDSHGHFIRCNRLATEFKYKNKGFEGLAYVRRDDGEYLFALCEGNLGKKAKRGGGRIDVFKRAADRGWKLMPSIILPKSAEFEDYAAITYRDGRLAVVSQASACVWTAEFNKEKHAIVPGSEAIYGFPEKSYSNVEGIAWLSEDTLIAVSDRRKDGQSKRCVEKDQSIHIFRMK